MKSDKLIELIRYPEKVSSEDLHELDDLVCRYPFFQTARILYLKALHLKAGSRFRNELKQSTVHITDHKQLFRYLNQQLFFESASYAPEKAELDEIVDERIREIDGHIEVTSPGIPAYPQSRGYARPEENETVSLNLSATPAERPMPNRPGTVPENTPATPAVAATANPPVVPSMDLDLEDEPVIVPASRKKDTPLATPEILGGAYRLKDEDHPPFAPAQPSSGKNKQKKNNQIIDQFIQTAPVMPKIKATTDTRDLSKENPFSSDELFSETLAKIYVKQRLYEKAIQTYTKLSLKYPEKSVYFADRIERIKQITNNQP